MHPLFWQRLEKPENTPDGGAIFKIHLKPDHFRNVCIEDLRLFVYAEWIHGGGFTVFSYVYFKDGDWYLYNSVQQGSLLANIIAVPGEMTEEEYYSTAIFTHRVTAHNLKLPECGKCCHC